MFVALMRPCSSADPLRNQEADVGAEDIRDLLWIGAILLGWLSILSLIGTWHARRKFHALLKAPLTEEVEHLTHVWENRVARWNLCGLILAGLSILCFAAWAIVRTLA